MKLNKRTRKELQANIITIQRISPGIISGWNTSNIEEQELDWEARIRQTRMKNLNQALTEWSQIDLSSRHIDFEHIYETAGKVARTANNLFNKEKNEELLKAIDSLYETLSRMGKQAKYTTRAQEGGEPLVRSQKISINGHTTTIIMQLQPITEKTISFILNNEPKSFGENVREQIERMGGHQELERRILEYYMQIAILVITDQGDKLLKLPETNLHIWIQPGRGLLGLMEENHANRTIRIRLIYTAKTILTLANNVSPQRNHEPYKTLVHELIHAYDSRPYAIGKSREQKITVHAKTRDEAATTLGEALLHQKKDPLLLDIRDENRVPTIWDFKHAYNNAYRSMQNAQYRVALWMATILLLKHTPNAYVTKGEKKILVRDVLSSWFEAKYIIAIPLEEKKQVYTTIQKISKMNVADFFKRYRKACHELGILALGVDDETARLTTLRSIAKPSTVGSFIKRLWS